MCGRRLSCGPDLDMTDDRARIASAEKSDQDPRPPAARRRHPAVRRSRAPDGGADHCTARVAGAEHHGGVRRSQRGVCRIHPANGTGADAFDQTGRRVRTPGEQVMVVVITGASAGVGRAAVRAFARNGADVGLLARGIHGLAAAEREVEAEGRRAIAIPADVADAETVEQAASRIERDLGPIDVWVNNAMVSVFSPVSELTPDDVQRVTEVTYLGVVYGTMAALKRMLPRDRGSIVQVGSALACRGIPLQAAYCGAKHAIQGFDNLWEPLVGDRGAHGRFGSRSLARSRQARMNEHLPSTAAGALLAIALAGCAARRLMG